MQTAQTPRPVLGLYDEQFWDRVKSSGVVQLQCCEECSTWRYPPGPTCPHCLSASYDWKQIAGTGEIMSWAMFRKTYLPQYPAPYNVIAVRLDEGPIIISNLVEDPAEGEKLIGRRVVVEIVGMDDGVKLPRFRLIDPQG